MSQSTAPACGPAPPEATYTDISTGIAAIQAYAQANGYAFRQRDKQHSRIVFVCDREGKYNHRGKNPNIHKSRQRHNTGTKKCGCLIKVAFRLDPISSIWSLEIVHPTHNHLASIAPIAYSIHRQASLDKQTYAQIIVLAWTGVSVAQILIAIRKQNPKVIIT